jgi:DNA mismatch endonuclease, patch repair protein
MWTRKENSRILPKRSRMSRSQDGSVSSGGSVRRGSDADFYPLPSSPAATAVMRGNRKRDTRPELALRSALHARGLRFRTQHPIRASKLVVRPDLVFARAKLAVFVDGCFWHRCPQHGTSPRANTNYWRVKLDGNVRRDRRVDLALKASDWVVLRLWEHERIPAAVERVVAALEDIHSRRRT